MKPILLLLRLLMCLSLIANGVGYARASTAMPFAHAAAAGHHGPHPRQPAHTRHHAMAAHPGPSCAHMQREAMQRPAAAVTVHCMDKKAGGDCCDKPCPCAGLQAMPVALDVQPVPPASGLAAPITGRLLSRHDGPRLGHLIRPPIG